MYVVQVEKCSWMETHLQMESNWSAAVPVPSCFYRLSLSASPPNSLFPSSVFIFCDKFSKLICLLLFTYYFAVDLTTSESVYTQACVYIFMIIMIWTQTLTCPGLSQGRIGPFLVFQCTEQSDILVFSSLNFHFPSHLTPYRRWREIKKEKK